MKETELIQHCLSVIPELILGLAICAVVLLDMFSSLRRSRVVCGSVALLGILWALAALIYPAPFANLVSGLFRDVKPLTGPDAFHGMALRDGLSFFFKLVFLLGAGATALFSMRSVETEGYRQGEYYGLLLGATLGASLLASSGHFVMFVLALETLSLCSYVLAGFIKHERISAEASLKYLLYGAVASGVMLFGISYLYGLSGTLDIPGAMRHFAANITQPAQALPLLLALVLLLVGLGFKMAMVPFQFWAPDVYQGAPTPVTAFLSVVSKAAGFSALLRVFLPLFGSVAGGALAHLTHLPVLFGVLAAVTMCFGNLVAIRQNDIKRLLAYSSIAHAGYILMAMTVYTPESVEMMLLYFFMYLFMNMGIFWCVIVLVNRLGGSDLDRFRGARYKAPFLFWVAFIFLISLTGVPPTAGFIGKLMIFKVVVSAGIGQMQNGALTPAAWGYFALALIGAVNSAIAAYYYLRVAKVMGFDQPADERPIPMDLFDCALALLFAIPVLALLYFAPVLKLVNVL